MFEGLISGMNGRIDGGWLLFLQSQRAQEGRSCESSDRFKNILRGGGPNLRRICGGLGRYIDDDKRRLLFLAFQSQRAQAGRSRESSDRFYVIFWFYNVF